MNRLRVGAMFRCTTEPEALPGFACRVEALGYDELWIVEDCFYASGIASAGAALAVSERMAVGLPAGYQGAAGPLLAALGVDLDELGDAVAAELAGAER